MTVSDLVDLLLGKIELGEINEDHGIIIFCNEIYTWEDHTKLDHLCVDDIVVIHTAVNPKGP